MRDDKKIYDAMYKDTRSLLQGVDFTRSDLELFIASRDKTGCSDYPEERAIIRGLYTRCLDELLTEREHQQKKKPRSRVKKALITAALIAGVGISAGVSTGIGLSVAGLPVIETGLSYIPLVVGHAEKGKYWEGVHESQVLQEKVTGETFERDTTGFFPDLSIIEKYWITGNDNKLLFSTEDGTKSVLLDKPTKQYVHLEDMRTLADAVVQREDMAFYTHHGISWKGVARAVVYRGKRGGGSTLTMQVAKQLRQERGQEPERGLERYYYQVIDMIIASEIEKHYSKEQILEFYLNNVYFGPKTYSAQYAAEFYFDKDAHDLTEAEALFLACLINTPGDITHIHTQTLASMFPLCNKDEVCIGQKREEEKERNEAAYEEKYVRARRRVQKDWIERRLTGDNGYENFLKHKWGDDEQKRKMYVNTIRDTLFRRVDGDAFDPETMRDSRYVENFPSAMWLLDWALKTEYGIDISEMRKDKERVYSMTLETTADSKLTRDVNTIFKRHFERLAYVEDFHYALVIVDGDGEVKVIIGDKNYDNFWDWNYATQGGRPVASTIKPFVYAYGLEAGIFDTHKTFSDKRASECNNPERRCVSNHDNIYGRTWSIPQALKNSNNVMAAQAYGEIKKKDSFEGFQDYMASLGITIDDENKNTDTVAIGIDEATPLRVALAYSSFLDGYAHDYTIINKIIIGDTERSKGDNPATVRIFSEQTLEYMQDSLQYVAQGRISHPNYYVGIKTGTYEDGRGISRDLWMAGTLRSKKDPTEGYAFALWVDNQTGELGPRVNSSQVLTPVMQDIVNCIH